MDALMRWIAQLNFEPLLELLVTAAACLLCLTFHECCHGLMALALGDSTARRMGRLSLNPLKHIDLVGLLLLAFARFGWAKPVPVDPRNFRDPKLGMALTALAGPVANVLLCFVALPLYGVTVWADFRFGGNVALEYVGLFFLYTAVLSAGLAVFTLLPVPPLDGSKILFAFLPTRWYAWILRYERLGMVLLLALVYSDILVGPLEAMRQAVLFFPELLTNYLLILLL